MPHISTFKPTRRWARALLVFVSFILATDVIPVLLLLLIDCSGYLPYSDRPGPGWQRPHLPQLAEINFYLGFIIYLAIPSLYYAAGQTFLAVIYELCSLPRWLVRVLGALLAFLSAGLLMEGAGWMIAISATGIYIAAACGLFWGLIILPALYAPRTPAINLPLRVALVAICYGAATFYLIRPFLPRKPIPPINLSVVRITPSSDQVDWKPSEFFQPQTWAEMESLHLHGEIHGGIQSAVSGEGQPIEVVIIALQALDRNYKFQIPASGHVVYILDHDTITAHTPFSATDDRTFVLKPGEDKHNDGGVLLQSDFHHDQAFTWYPTIRR